MNNKKIRLLALVLAILLVLPFAACGEDTPATTPNQGQNQNPPADEVKYDLSKYAIVYSNKIGYYPTEATNALANTLADKFGTSFMPSTDFIAAEQEFEILIGDTKRPESAEALALVTNDDSFVIKTINGKIVINAKTYDILTVAVSYFAKMARENSFAFTEDIQYVSPSVSKVTLFENNTTNYVVGYSAELDDTGNGHDGRNDFEVETAALLNTEIKKLGGPELSVGKETVQKSTIIYVGYCTDEDSVAFHNSLGLNEYGFEVKNGKVYVSGTNTTTTRLAVTLFVNTMKKLSSTTNGLSVEVYDGMRVTARTSTWNVDVPEYEGGERFGTLNAGGGAFGICYENTTAEEFEAYCKKLESEGYVLWQRHDIEDNLHATYTHEKKGMIHTYFTGNEKNVRILTYKPGTYNLPKNPTRYTYESVTKTAITQYALDRKGGSVGMCYVITLEDGSFIVIDGGTNNDAGNMQKEFYQLLKDLNKRPDGKIVIKAWYVTHEHGDHTGMFRAFMKDYGKQVTIEELWCNPTSTDYTYFGDNGGFGNLEKNYKTYKNQVNGDFTWITLHTGMEFYAANMKFEVLYTEEDFFPRTLKSGNDTCLVMKMTDLRSGQVTLWMGDTLLRGCKTISEKYDTYLKADILQMAHHGKSEALPVYQQVLPTVAMWSCTTSMMNNQTTGSSYKIYWDTNKFIRDNVPVQVTSDYTYTIYLPYKQGDNIAKWVH